MKKYYFWLSEHKIKFWLSVHSFCLAFKKLFKWREYKVDFLQNSALIEIQEIGRKLENVKKNKK